MGIEIPKEKIDREKQKLEIISDNGFTILQFIFESTLPFLVTLYEESSSADLRLAAIMAIHKMFSFANPHLLATSPVVNPHKLCHMLFGVMESKNSSAVSLGLGIVEQMLEK